MFSGYSNRYSDNNDIQITIDSTTSTAFSISHGLKTTQNLHSTAGAWPKVGGAFVYAYAIMRLELESGERKQKDGCSISPGYLFHDFMPN